MRQWERKISRWTSVPFLLEEVHRRMLNRAEIMRPVEGDLLVQGWMHAETLQALQAQFAGRVVHLVNPAARPIEPRSRASPAYQDSSLASKFKSFLSKVVTNSDSNGGTHGQGALRETVEYCVAKPGEGLPLPDNSQALVWSPLWLHQINDIKHLMSEWHRVLKPDGGVFFSCFGPDTARELRSFAAAMGQQLPDFSDMHDLGDALSRQGFSDPVMEMEKVTLTYADPRKMIAEWRQINANLLSERPDGLSGKAALAAAYSNLQRDLAAGAQRYHLTLELVYGHAWKVQRLRASKITTVSVKDIGGRRQK